MLKVNNRHKKKFLNMFKVKNKGSRTNISGDNFHGGDNE